MLAAIPPHNGRHYNMKKLMLLTSGIALCAGMAVANDDLVGLMDDSANWAIQTGRRFWVGIFLR